MTSPITITVAGENKEASEILAARIIQMLAYLNIDVTGADSSVRAKTNTVTQVDVTSIIEPIQVQVEKSKRDQFFDHLQSSSDLVESWPDWKKQAAGLKTSYNEEKKPSVKLTKTQEEKINDIFRAIKSRNKKE